MVVAIIGLFLILGDRGLAGDAVLGRVPSLSLQSEFSVSRQDANRVVRVAQERGHSARAMAALREIGMDWPEIEAQLERLNRGLEIIKKRMSE